MKHSSNGSAAALWPDILGKWLDGFAVGASTLCMIHCLALPILLAALPMLTAWLDFGENFHLAMLAFAIPVSSLALIGGWRRHRNTLPLAAGIGGLLLMGCAIMFASTERSEAALTVLGGVMLAAAHIANWRLRPRCADVA